MKKRNDLEKKELEKASIDRDIETFKQQHGFKTDKQAYDFLKNKLSKELETRGELDVNQKPI